MNNCTLSCNLRQPTCGKVKNYVKLVRSCTCEIYSIKSLMMTFSQIAARGRGVYAKGTLLIRLTSNDHSIGRLEIHLEEVSNIHV